MLVSSIHDQLKGFTDVLSLQLNFVKWVGYDLTFTLEDRKGERVTLLCENDSLLKLEVLGGIKQLWIRKVSDLRSDHLDVIKLRFDWLDVHEEIVSFNCAKATVLTNDKPASELHRTETTSTPTEH